MDDDEIVKNIILNQALHDFKKKIERKQKSLEKKGIKDEQTEKILEHVKELEEME